MRARYAEGGRQISGMTLTIEVPDYQAAEFKARAEAHGLTIEEWLRQLAEKQIESVSIAHLQKIDPEE